MKANVQNKLMIGAQPQQDLYKLQILAVENKHED